MTIYRPREMARLQMCQFLERETKYVSESKICSSLKISFKVCIFLFWIKTSPDSKIQISATVSKDLNQSDGRWLLVLTILNLVHMLQMGCKLCTASCRCKQAIF